MEYLPIDEDEYDAIEVFRKWQSKQVHGKNLLRQLQFQQRVENEAKIQAAKKIQQKYRTKKAIKQLERIALRTK
jgi:hypothetical protein